MKFFRRGVLGTYIGYFQTHWQKDFQLQAYLLAAIWCAIGIAINYSIDLENSLIDRYQGSPIRWLWYFLLYAGAYYPPLFLLLRAKQQLSLFFEPDVWAWSLAGLAILALDRSFDYHTKWVEKIADIQVYYFLMRVCNNLYSLLTVCVPLLVLYVGWYRYKAADGFFGLKMSGVTWKPYVLMLLCMIPLVWAASFTPDFSSYYPRYKSYEAHIYWEVSEWVTILLYELAYGWDFIAVELLFRGFFVIAIGHIIGTSSILPMAVMYCFLHFGKPLGETVSSLFGGYILGVLAYYTRNIWGGIMVHLGIAWLMELAAFYQKYR